jgi:tetratricopeptide (TPR) repeat protein
VRNKLSVAILAVAISSGLGLGAAWGQTPQPKKPEWKDRAEYDLEQSAEKEQDPKKKLDLLNQWKKDYPNTDFKMLRLDQYLATYRALQDAANSLDTAQEMLREDPKYINALFWTCLLVVSSKDGSPARLDIGEKAANTLVSNLDEFFAPDKKPAAATDAAWKQARTDLAALANRTLGWVNKERKNQPEAEKYITEDLKLNPNDAEASYWLGTIIRQKPERMSEALFQFARAAAYDGPGAMDATTRQTVLEYITKVYTSFHGQDADGLRQLLALAKTQALPPAGFKVLSEDEVKEQKLQQKGKDNPSLPFWVKAIKEPLTAADGVQTFESNVKNAMIPPPDQPALQGAVISCEPARNPKTVTVGIENPSVPEVKLVFEVPLARPAEPGTIIKFRGVATAFTKHPFLLTFEVDKKDLSGWPAPAPAKKAATHKATKKK